VGRDTPVDSLSWLNLSYGGLVLGSSPLSILSQMPEKIAYFKMVKSGSILFSSLKRKSMSKKTPEYKPL